MSVSATSTDSAPREDHAHRAASMPEPRGMTPAWRAGLTASVLLHGAAVGAVMFGLTWLAPAIKPADSVMTVELAPAPSAPPAPVRQTPPGPQRTEAVTRPRPMDQPKFPPPPKLLIPVKADVVLPPKPDPQLNRPVQKETVDETTAPQSTPAPPRQQMAAPIAGASTVASNAPQTWESLLEAKLQRNKRYPGAAQDSGQQDVVYVRMAIDRAGRLMDANVVRSRGYALLDSEAVALAHRASPFPAPPADEAGDPIVLVVPVEFFITRHHGG